MATTQAPQLADRLCEQHGDPDLVSSDTKQRLLWEFSRNFLAPSQGFLNRIVHGKTPEPRYTKEQLAEKLVQLGVATDIDEGYALVPDVVRTEYRPVGRMTTWGGWDISKRVFDSETDGRGNAVYHMATRVWVDS
ncbi:MAG: hypothetical protein KKF56_01915 [Nanoarchaeota archaeon]|nr:hypothetical protein [Nanoarchaeota archaeon]